MGAKKIVHLIIGLILSAAFGTGFLVLGSDISDIGSKKYSETFTGVVSSSTYSSKEKAAEAFVFEEMKGETSKNITYKSYSVVKSLSADDVRALNVPNTENAYSGEKVKIEFLDDQIEYSVHAYLIDTPSGIRFIAPLAENGEKITNSYFASVFAGEHYLNCTATTVVGVRSGEVSSSYRQTIYIAEDKAFFDQGLPGFSTDMYFKDNGGSITPYLKHPQRTDDDNFYSLSEINSSSGNIRYEVVLIKGNEQLNVSSFSSMKDITDFMFMFDVDASYFVKTDYGFAMTNEKYKEACRVMLGLNDEQVDSAWYSNQISFEARYYVTDGKLSAAVTYFNILEDGQINSISVTTKYTDFGTTVVDIPVEGV